MSDKPKNEEVKKRIDKFNEEYKTISEGFSDIEKLIADASVSERKSEFIKKIEKYITDSGCSDMKSFILEKAPAITEKWISPEFRDEFMWCLENMTLWPVNYNGIYVSVSDVPIQGYTDRLINITGSFHRWSIFRYPAKAVVTIEQMSEEDRYLWYHGKFGFFKYSATALLAAGDKQTEKFVYDIVDGTSKFLRMHRAVAISCFQSGIEKHFEKCYEFFENAGIEEDARKMIAQASDYGTTAARSWFCRKITDDKLFRFVSVKNMFSLEYEIRGMFKKQLKDKDCENMTVVIADVLEGKNVEKYFSSSDKWTVYAAFAGTAERSYKELMSVLEKFIFEGTDFQKESAHFFIKNCGISFQALWGRSVFEKCSDFRTLALFSDCFLADTPIYTMISNDIGQFLYETGYYGYLIYANDIYEKPKEKTEPVYSPSLKDSNDAEYLLGLIWKLYDSIGKEKYIFPSETEKYTLNKGNLAELICILSFESGNRENILKATELIPEVASRKGMTSMSGRDICLCLLFLAEESEELIQNAFPFLADKDRRTRLAAEYILGQTVPSSETVAVLENKLSVKSDEIRNIVLEALKRLDENKRYECAQRLISDGNEERNKAGKSLMKTVSGKKITGSVKKIQFFNPEKIKFPEFVLRKSDIADFCSIFTGSVLNSSDSKICSSDDERRILQELDKIFEENKNYEYETDDGTAVLLGNKFTRISNVWGLESLPLSEVWKSFYKEKIGSYSKLLRVMLCMETERYTYFSIKGWALYGNEFEKTESLNYQRHIEMLLHWFQTEYQDYETNKLIFRIISYYAVNVLTDEERTDKSKKFEHGSPAYGRVCFDADLFRFTGFRPYGVYGKPEELSDDEFKEYYSLNIFRAGAFDEEYLKHEYSGWFCRDGFDENIRAYRLGTINRDTLLYLTYNYGISRITSSFRKIILSGNSDNQNDDEIIRDLYNTLAVPMIDVEITRDDDKTEYTDKVFSMSAVYGTERFVKILEYFGKEKFHRGRIWGQENITKNQSFSHMLKKCIPGENEDAETLKKFLKGKKISDQRLVEAALYSSDKWINIIGEYLGWEGFETCCLFFISHAGSYINDEQKSLIERCTRLKSYDILCGVCDPEWLKKVYTQTGEKHFKSIYDAAKYISESNTHTRARKYSDAVLGKYDADKVRAEIEQKRNKDLLSAYALIPLKDTSDAVERYLYFLKFYKEAKKFGTQRCESEQIAALTAIHNLAVNSGYTDVHRFRLRMDNFFMEENSKYFEWTETEGVSLRIIIKEKGKATVEAMKDGKILKAVPASLKKNSLLTELRTISGEITEQYRRTRNMFEKAMENGIPFDVSELMEFLKNPAASPVVRGLVFKSDDKMGFFTEEGLKAYDGKIYSVDKDEKLIPAHCSDLYKAGTWREYQKYLYDTETVQPFRQVFRELYTKTSEESEMRYTSRYDGYKVEGRKATGCLSSRGWSCYHETIMEKVFHDSDILAEIKCSSYWYSNYSSSSSETDIKKILFYDFKKHEYMKICDVSDTVFSEVMRDADLAVSVAHSSETDPETSLSTVEMRKSIAEFTLNLFNRDNVRFEKNHAFIKGKIAEYSVHLGSGIVHITGGPQIVINTVKPSVKGKIFLPYEDENDKTAEIITKMLLLTEDTKIKDQYIYGQIILAAEKV